MASNSPFLHCRHCYYITTHRMIYKIKKRGKKKVVFFTWWDFESPMPKSAQRQNSILCLQNINSGRPNEWCGRWSIRRVPKELRKAHGIRGHVKLWKSNQDNLSPPTLMPWPPCTQADVVLFAEGDCNLSPGVLCPTAMGWWLQPNGRLWPKRKPGR